MSRGITSENLARIRAAKVPPFYAFELWNGGNSLGRYCFHDRDIYRDQHISRASRHIAIGGQCALPASAENLSGTTLTYSNITNETAAAMESGVRGAACDLYLMMLRQDFDLSLPPETTNPITTYTLWQTRMRVVSAHLTEDTASLRLEYEPLLEPPLVRIRFDEKDYPGLYE